MARGKYIFTTGDVAKICHVAPRTVSIWFDNGQLKGYRIPGSNNRRIPVSNLISFVQMDNTPTKILKFGKIRVLLAYSKNKRQSDPANLIRTKAEYEPQTIQSNFVIRARVKLFGPYVLPVSLLNESIDAISIYKYIRTDEDLRTIKIIAIVNQLDDSQSGALLQKGFDTYVCCSADTTEVIKKY